MDNLFMACLVLVISVAAGIYYVETAVEVIARRDRRFFDAAGRITKALISLDQSAMNLRKVIG